MTAPAAGEPAARGRRLWLAAAGVVVGGGALAAGWWHQQEQSRLASEQAAVEIFFSQILPDSNGEVFRFDQLRGKPVVINFWATWCAPCVEEMPELSDLATEVGPDQIRFVGVGVDSQPRIAAFSKRLPVSYPLIVANATGAFMSTKFGNSGGGLPYTVVIDASGQVRERFLGRVQIESLRKVLKSLEQH